MSTPLISIIIPVKNEEKYIQETLESIQRQTYTEFEVLICDDHSEDNTFGIVSSYAVEDHRIKVFRNEGEGIISALKTIEKHISAEWVTRMDGDDVMPTNKLELFMQNRQESSIVTGKVKYFSNEPISKGYRDYQNWLNSRVDLKDHDKHIFRECVIASANWLTSKGILTKIGGLTNGIYPEDYDLCFRLYANNVPVLSLPEVTHFWREHKERTSRTSSDYNQESFFKLKLHYINNLFQGKSIAYFGAGTKMKLFKKYVDVHVTYYQLENNENDTKKHYTEVDEDILFLGMYPSVQRRIELEDFLAKRGFVIGENTFYL